MPRISTRLASLTAVLLSISLMVVAPHAHAIPAACGTAAGFEIDGNLVSLAGGLDWYKAAGNVGSGVLFRKTDSNPCAPVDATRTHFERDPSWAQGDNDITVFGKTSDKNNSCIVIGQQPWNFKSGSGPQKNDLTEAYATVRVDEDPLSPTFGHTFFIAGVGHRETNGDNHIDFEINALGLVDIFDQGSTTQGITIGGAGTENTCGRLPNVDQIISVDFDNGGTNPMVTRHEWKAIAGGYQYVEATVFGAYACINTGVVEAPCDATQPASSFQLGPSYQKNQFVEVAIDLTASGVPIEQLCRATTTLSIKSRSSSSFTAELKDRVTFPFQLAPPPPCAITGPEDICKDAALTLCGPSGSGLTYSWSGDGIPAGESDDVCIHPTGLSVGTHTYTLTVDRAGCSTTCEHTVTVNEVTLSLASTDVTCKGDGDGSITATFSGGTEPYGIQLDGGASQTATSPFEISDLGPGTYTVLVTDAKGCKASKSVTIREPDALRLSETHTNIRCFGGTGSIDLSVSGGTAPYTYEWSNGATTQDLSGLSAGSYTVTVTDDHDCTATLEVTITGVDAIVLTETHVDVSCFGGSNGSINLTISGGTPPYSKSWSNGATTEDLSGLPAGTYSVTVTDANDCTANLSIPITQPAVLSLSETHSGPTCLGTDGAIDLTISGGTSPYAKSWSNGASTEDLSNLGPGTYSVEVTDANGCKASKSVTLGSPMCGQIAPTQTTCEDFQDGNADDINRICYGVKSGKINNAAPGVFFYFSRVTAPASSFTVTIVQTNSNANFPYFSIQSGDQVVLYDPNCNVFLRGTESSRGQGTISVTGATVGQEYIVSVKYEGNSVVGTQAGSRPTVHYNFRTNVNGQLSDADPNGLDLAHCVGGAGTVIAEGAQPASVEAGASISDGLELYRATPNPFTSGMRLAYRVGGSGSDRVEIGVFDLGGRRIQTLLSGEQAPGRHVVTWDGSTEAGQRAGNGVYFIHVRTGSEQRIVRVALMR